MELLEGRDVPAAFYWNPLSGSDLLASTAANWVDASGVRMTAEPGIADDLYFTGIGIIPTSTESLVFGEESVVPPGSPPPPPPPPPTVNAQDDCLITSSNSSAPVERHYNGVHVMAGYTGTVDFQVSSFVGTLELRAGNIAQNDAFYATAGGGHLAVTVHMDWTGGTLNNGSMAGWVHLVGATGIIDSGSTAGLSLGSTVYLHETAAPVSSDLWVGSGGVLQAGGWGIVIGGSSTTTQTSTNASAVLPILRLSDLYSFDWSESLWDDLPVDSQTPAGDDFDLSFAFALQPNPQPPAGVPQRLPLRARPIVELSDLFTLAENVPEVSALITQAYQDGFSIKNTAAVDHPGTILFKKKEIHVNLRHKSINSAGEGVAVLLLELLRYKNRAEQVALDTKVFDNLLTKDQYVTECEKLGYKYTKEHSQIAKKAFDDGLWPTSVDKFGFKLTYDWLTFDDYLATQVQSDHVRFFKARYDTIRAEPGAKN